MATRCDLPAYVLPYSIARKGKEKEHCKRGPCMRSRKNKHCVYYTHSVSSTFILPNVTVIAWGDSSKTATAFFVEFVSAVHVSIGVLEFL